MFIFNEREHISLMHLNPARSPVSCTGVLQNLGQVYQAVNRDLQIITWNSSQEIAHSSHINQISSSLAPTDAVDPKVLNILHAV